jgi:transposase-like protein
MINWELPHEKVACPHCGSTETHVTLQLLGLVRYSCDTCRKSFAVHGGKTAARTEHQTQQPAESSTTRS